MLCPVGRDLLRWEAQGVNLSWTGGAASSAMGGWSVVPGDSERRKAGVVDEGFDTVEVIDGGDREGEDARPGEVGAGRVACFAAVEVDVFAAGGEVGEKPDDPLPSPPSMTPPVRSVGTDTVLCIGRSLGERCTLLTRRRPRLVESQRAAGPCGNRLGVMCVTQACDPVWCSAQGGVSPRLDAVGR